MMDALLFLLVGGAVLLALGVGCRRGDRVAAGGGSLGHLPGNRTTSIRK
jgi:hypothetical protein